MSIAIVPHDPTWSEAFSVEAEAIRSALNNRTKAIHHIGSTAIPGILAKPIIDMMGVADDLAAIDVCSSAMRLLGYEVMGAFGMEERRYFRKFDAGGRRTHHLHVFSIGSPHITRHLAFRDYLRSHCAKAVEYSALKQEIVLQDSVSWEEYMDKKEAFIDETERLAVDWYRRFEIGSSDR